MFVWGLLAVAGACPAGRASGQADNGGVGYPSPAAAMQALRSRPDVVFWVNNGWTVAQEKSTGTIWSFAPESDPSYPSVAKRELIREAGAWSVKTNILCGATQSACNKLAADFKKLDDAMRQDIQSHHP
jgi:hypothetical protein